MKKFKSSKKAAKKTIKRAKAKKAIKKDVVRRAVVGSFARRRERRNLALIRKKMFSMLPIVVNNAEYLHDNTLRVTFSDGYTSEVDFSGFFESNTMPYLKKYKSQQNFKKFNIEDGNVVWGKDWDLIFPIEQLYAGKIKL